MSAYWQRVFDERIGVVPLPGYRTLALVDEDKLDAVAQKLGPADLLVCRQHLPEGREGARLAEIAAESTRRIDELRRDWKSNQAKPIGKPVGR